METCDVELAFYDCGAECETTITCMVAGDPGHVRHEADVRTGTGHYARITWMHYKPDYVPGIRSAGVLKKTGANIESSRQVA